MTPDQRRTGIERLLIKIIRSTGIRDVRRKKNRRVVIFISELHSLAAEQKKSTLYGRKNIMQNRNDNDSFSLYRRRNK